MLGFFPTLYPDETLFSGWARYVDQLAYPAKSGYLFDLFGITQLTHYASAQFLFERRIGDFVKRLPVNHKYSVDYLIDNHTLLNLYRFTVNQEKFQLAKNAMEITQPQNSSVYRCFRSSKNFMPDYARFCPQCTQEDIQNFGETYWHRIHQIPGIHICQTHKCWLENSNFMIKKQHLNLVSAQETIPKTCKTKPISSGVYETLQLRFAENAAWLLKNPEHNVFFENIQNKYLNILCKQDLASKTGQRFFQKKIQERVNSLFSSTDLKLIGEKIHGTDKVWESLARKGRHYIQPTTHFYVMYVLGLTIQQVFRCPETIGLFGAGPWKCWNQFCAYYEQEVIQRVKLVYPSSKKGVGLFACSCGFSYSLSEKNQGLDDVQIRRFGSIWRKEVFKITGNNKPSAKALAQCLEIELSLAKKYKKILQNEGIFLKTRDNNRNQCLKLLAIDPNLSRQQFSETDPNLYSWFMREDYEWYDQIMPRKWVDGNNIYNKFSQPINWEQQDKELAQKIKKAYKVLLNKPGRPIQVSASGLFEQAKAPYWRFARKKHKFPQTDKVIGTIVETPKEFTTRLVSYYVDMCVKHSVIPTESSYLLIFSRHQLFNGLSDIYEAGYQTILNSFNESDNIQVIDVIRHKFPTSPDE